MVAGVVIFSKRAEAIAAYLSSLELAFVSARLDSRELHVEVDLDTQYLLARLRTPTQVHYRGLFDRRVFTLVFGSLDSLSWPLKTFFLKLNTSTFKLCTCVNGCEW